MMHAIFLLMTLAVLKMVEGFTALPIEINNPPSIIYWGCDYPLLVSGGDGTHATVNLIDSSGKVVSQLFQDINIGPPNEFVPLPGIVPAGIDLFLQAEDSHTIATSNKFKLVAKEKVPSNCDAAPAASTMTFPVPSTSTLLQTSSTSSSATASSTSVSSSTSTAQSTLPSSSPTVSISSMMSTSMSMAVSVPTATPTVNVGAGGQVLCHDFDPRVPPEWQCEPGSTCITLDDASSAICCNDHVANCTTIFALDCDIQQQNVTAHPSSPIFTTWLESALPSCGQRCCPFGYYCHHSADELDWHCLMATYSSSINKTVEELVREPKASAPPAANATATNMFMPPAIASVVPGDSTQAETTAGNATKSSNRPLSSGSIAGVAVGAFAGLALIIAAIAWILRRRKKQNNSASDDLDIKPYEFTTPQAAGSAGGNTGGRVVNSRFSEAGMSDGTEYHVEKDGQPILSPTLSPIVEKDAQPLLRREDSPRRGPNGAVYEMA